MLTDPSIAKLIIKSAEQTATAEQTAAGQSLLELLHRRLKLGGVSVGRDKRMLDDGTLVEASIIGPINTVIVTPTSAVSSRRLSRTTLIPSFLSGTAVSTPLGFGRSKKLFYPTELSLALSRDTGLARTGSAMPAFVPSGEPPARFGSPSQVKPGLFSGAMRRFVQIMNSFGTQKDDSRFKVTEALLAENQADQDRFADELKDEHRVTREIYEHQKSPPHRVFYDHRYTGLVFTESGRPVFITISPLGVHIHLVPLIEETRSTGFRALCESISVNDGDTRVADNEALAILDFLGGFPHYTELPSDERSLDFSMRCGMSFEIVPADSENYVEAFASKRFVWENSGWAFSEDSRHAAAALFHTPSEGAQFVAYVADISPILLSEIPAARGKQIELRNYLLLNVDRNVSLTFSEKLMLCHKTGHIDEQQCDELVRTLAFEETHQHLIDAVLAAPVRTRCDTEFRWNEIDRGTLAVSLNLENYRESGVQHIFRLEYAGNKLIQFVQKNQLFFDFSFYIRDGKYHDYEPSIQELESGDWASFYHQEVHISIAGKTFRFFDKVDLEGTGRFREASQGWVCGVSDIDRSIAYVSYEKNFPYTEAVKNGEAVHFEGIDQSYRHLNLVLNFCQEVCYLDGDATFTERVDIPFTELRQKVEPERGWRYGDLPENYIRRIAGQAPLNYVANTSKEFFVANHFGERKLVFGKSSLVAASAVGPDLSFIESDTQGNFVEFFGKH